MRATSDALFSQLFEAHKRHWSSGCQPIDYGVEVLASKDGLGLATIGGHVNTQSGSGSLFSEQYPEQSGGKVLATSYILMAGHDLDVNNVK